MSLRFLPPNMAALFGPAIGARTSRQDELGYMTHRASAQSNTIKSFIVLLSLILPYLLSGGRLTGPTTVTPANLPFGKASCIVPPTNITTKLIPASRDAKYVPRGPLLYITHNIQLTPLNKTIDDHPANIIHKNQRPQRQDQVRKYPKHTPQRIIHINTSNMNYKSPRYTQLPGIWPSRQNNQSKLAQIWTSRSFWPEIIQTYLKRNHQIIPHKNSCNTDHNSPTYTLLSTNTWFSLQNNLFKNFRHLKISCHVDGSCAAAIHDAHLSTNVEIILTFVPENMLSPFTTRFEAVAASLDASYPPAKIHFTGDYTPISQNCAQHGRSLVLLDNHLQSLGSLNGIKDLTPFNIPERITDIPQEYRAAFLLSDGSRDEEINNLRSYELEVIAQAEDLRVAAIARSTNIETYLLHVNGDQKQLDTTYQTVLAMAQETLENPDKFGALPPLVTKPLFASIEEATHLLQETITATRQQHDTITHHRELLGHAITALTIHQPIATHRGEYYAALAQGGRRPRGDLNSIQRYYSPNLHELTMVTEHQVAAARAAAAAFDASGNRVQPPSPPLGLFHLFPLPVLSMNPYARGLLPSDIHPENPKFNFLAIKEGMGDTYSHRPDPKQRDYPIRIVWTGWNSETHTPNQIQRALYTLELDMHESAVFPPKKRRDTAAPALCHIVYSKMTNLLWACIHSGGGFIRDIPFSCKVAVGTGDITIGKYHYWGTVSDAASHMHPLTFMSNAEDIILRDIGVHVKICPQQLTPNWLAACCDHGRFDLVFRNPKDIQKYVKHPHYPITPEVMTGFGTLIESAILTGEVKLREDMGPFQIELISLPPSVTEGTLIRYFAQIDMDFCGLTKRATKARTNTWTVGFLKNMPDRLDAANLLGNALVPHISRSPLRINVKQRNIPRGACIICYHELNKLRFNHPYKQCPNRNAVCRYCHSANHPAQQCPYVLSDSHVEPEARAPTPRPIAAPRRHSVRPSPEQHAQQALGRRSMISVRSRGKPAFSDDEDESEGELEREPQPSSRSRSAASVAAAYRPTSGYNQDLTGTVTPANMLHWSSSQDRQKPPAARR